MNCSCIGTVRLASMFSRVCQCPPEFITTKHYKCIQMLPVFAVAFTSNVDTCTYLKLREFKSERITPDFFHAFMDILVTYFTYYTRFRLHGQTMFDVGSRHNVQGGFGQCHPPRVLVHEFRIGARWKLSLQPMAHGLIKQMYSI